MLTGSRQGSLMPSGNSRSKSITPYLQPGRNSYVATFRGLSGKRQTRGLGTDDPSIAQQICASLEELNRKDIRNLSETPTTTHPRALQLYFGVENLGQMAAKFAKEGISTYRLNRVLNHEPKLWISCCAQDA